MIKASFWFFCPHFSNLMKERIVIIFIAVTLGLVATTIGFFVYETAKPNKVVNPTTKKQEQVFPKSSITLTVLSPADETVTAKRTIEVKGKTDPQNTIIVSTNEEDVVATPTSNGDFSASISIDSSVNKVVTEAVAPDGTSTKDVRTISFSTDEL
ncbi:MAG: hypothetical protein ACM3IJ_04115 [Candidatus Levyibacteriota bacterium]